MMQLQAKITKPNTQWAIAADRRIGAFGNPGMNCIHR